MDYQCQDCSYKASRFPQGICPGCGSHNVRRRQTPPEPQPPRARKPYRLLLAIALWLYLIVELARKLLE